MHALLLFRFAANSTMDLDETQRYAAAALFTSLLHAKQLEAGIAGDAEAVKARKSAWGEPASTQQFNPPSTEPSQDGFWGFDCVSSGGLCERVYEHLQVSKTKWAALKQLPQVCWQPRPVDKASHSGLTVDCS